MKGEVNIGEPDNIRVSELSDHCSNKSKIAISQINIDGIVHGTGVYVECHGHSGFPLIFGDKRRNVGDTAYPNLVYSKYVWSTVNK